MLLARAADSMVLIGENRPLLAAIMGCGGKSPVENISGSNGAQASSEDEVLVLCPRRQTALCELTIWYVIGWCIHKVFISPS